MKGRVAPQVPEEGLRPFALERSDGKRGHETEVAVDFRAKDGGWSEPRELGEILNMEGNQARISPDGKYVFFVRNDGMAYWVAASIIDRLRPNGERRFLVTEHGLNAPLPDSSIPATERDLR